MTKAKKEAKEAIVQDDGLSGREAAHGADNGDALKVLEHEAKEEDNA